MKLKLYIIFLISPFFLQLKIDTSVEGEVPAPLSKIEQLILILSQKLILKKDLILVDLILKKNN